jgi:hypothetical protein
MGAGGVGDLGSPEARDSSKIRRLSTFNYLKKLINQYRIFKNCSLN